MYVSIGKHSAAAVKLATILKRIGAFRFPLFRDKGRPLWNRNSEF